MHSDTNISEGPQPSHRSDFAVRLSSWELKAIYYSSSEAFPPGLTVPEAFPPRLTVPEAFRPRLTVPEAFPPRLTALVKKMALVRKKMPAPNVDSPAAKQIERINNM